MRDLFPSTFAYLSSWPRFGIAVAVAVVVLVVLSMFSPWVGLGFGGTL